jgi:putative LysE/RhtB family amino acid efflux pump
VIAAVVAGLGLGFVIAAQVGPVALLCVRTVLRHGLASGLGIGAGAALIDTFYGALGMLGAAQLLRADAVRVAIGLFGAAVLVFLGGRTLWAARSVQVRLDPDAAPEDRMATPLGAFRVSVLTMLSNPSTIIYWATAFAATSTAALTTSVATSGALLTGVFVGTSAWFTLLASAAAFGQRWIGDRAARVVDVVAGVGIIGFGVLLAVRTLA